MKRFLLNIFLLMITTPVVAQFYEEPAFGGQRIMYVRMGQQIPGIKKVTIKNHPRFGFFWGRIYFSSPVEIKCDTSGNTVNEKYWGWAIDAPYHEEVKYEYDSLGRKISIQKNIGKYVNYTEKRSYISRSNLKMTKQINLRKYLYSDSVYSDSCFGFACETEKYTYLPSGESWKEVKIYCHQITSDTFSRKWFPDNLRLIKDSIVHLIISDTVNKKIIYFGTDWCDSCATVVYYDSLMRIKEIRYCNEAYSTGISGGTRYSYYGNSPFVEKEIYYDSDKNAIGKRKYHYKFYHNAAGKKARSIVSSR